MKLRMELVKTADGDAVEIEYGGKTEIRQERHYRVIVSEQGVMVEARPGPVDQPKG
jgi:hypothetical protein